MALLTEERHLNETIDFSFNYAWEGSGDWGDSDKYQIEVPNKNVNVNDIPSSVPDLPAQAVITFHRKTT